MGQVLLSGALSELAVKAHQIGTIPDFLLPYFLPYACASISVGILLVQVLLSKRRDGQPELDYATYQHNTKVIFAWKTVRLLVCVILAALTAISGLPDTYGECSSANCTSTHSVALYSSLFYIYSALLAILSLTLARGLRIAANFHLVVLLLVAFSVQAWKYLVPFALSNQIPAESYGWLTWLHLGLLGFVAVIVPLCIPRLYIPLDPKNPVMPNAEQTASLISLITFTFMDPIVYASYCAPKLEYDQLPTLADYDHGTVLRQRGLDALDPMKGERNRRRHVFWGLMQIFWMEYSVMAVMAVIKAILELSGPLGIRFLLTYIEHPSEPQYFRPWVWVLWLFLAPTLGSLALQRYLYFAGRCTVRAEAIITQILFEHSLRIRMVAAVASKPSMTSDIASERTDTEREVVDSSQTSGSTTVVAAETSATNKGDEKDGDEGSNLIGKINNLMSTDLGNIVEARDFIFILTFVPIQIIFSALLLYWILGWSAVVGMACMILFFPIPGKIAHLVNGIQEEKMKKTDARVQSITEVMNVIRMIKLFGWETKTSAQVNEKRETELHWYKKKRTLVLANLVTNYILPTIVMMITFACHTLVFKQSLDASMVFSSIGVFELLRNQLHYVFAELAIQVQAKVSLDRVNDFMKNTELLDVYSKIDTPPFIEPEAPYPSAIGFRNATFTWARRAVSTPTPSTRNFKLVIDQELLFHRGKINMIVGPTGCGKTCLLMALLGEMHFSPSGPDSWFALPREGGIAYAAQEAWVLNETIRDNILFGSEYDEIRYNKVLSQCALDKDLALFDAGDQTEVGEKGLTLSGGQKARISLARAIYSKAEIVILDDVLSALDVHTSRWIVDNCFRGDLVASRTVLIVTHNVAMVSEVADFVVSLGTSGRIVSQGYVSEVLRTNARFKAEFEKEKHAEAVAVTEVINGIEEERPKNATTKGDGKLMVEEEVTTGHIGWPAIKLFLFSFGGFWFWLVCLGSFMLADVALTLQSYWIGVWARAYSAYPGHPEQVNATFYLAVYIAICLAGVCMYSGAYMMYILGSVRAAHRVHGRLVASILGAPLRWLDSTPVGRIISRFTQDIRCVDEALPLYLESFINVTFSMCSSFLVVIIFSPRFIIPGTTILAGGLWLGHMYLRAQLSVKREMSNARSPLFSHFGTALAGITSIRAYGAEDHFKNEAVKRVDEYTRPGRTFFNLNRWMSFRMDVLGGVFAAGLAAYLVYAGSSPDATKTGFSLNRAVVLSASIIWWVRYLNDLEVQGNSLERIQSYLEIEQEVAPVPEKVPPAHWPSSGNITVENLTARYSSDNPAVLHGLSFEIKSGERIGIVGRTGSGKSSLTLSLLRMLPIEGNIYYDGIPTHAINLDALRSSITIIPQQPELMSGTVRQNLDPFDEHDDAFLNAALHSAGLDSIQPDDSRDRIGLDTAVGAGGSNFSLGQRQILALARAIVRRSKVLILDEATAAIDHDADTAIQTSIRTELKEMTLIIVAHRLQTICDADKIMVLEAGKIVEFDSPITLLQKEHGIFKALVDESGDRDKLYAMAKCQQN
ncbi:P-loop containing nucleoside triphosphate hydrolase protein [Rhizoctonia solani]|nr:P-loop containing nucleoside triphosphate hydrolase protein [Rhizoctonia solani]